MSTLLDDTDHDIITFREATYIESIPGISAHITTLTILYIFDSIIGSIFGAIYYNDTDFCDEFIMIYLFTLLPIVLICSMMRFIVYSVDETNTLRKTKIIAAFTLTLEIVYTVVSIIILRDYGGCHREITYYLYAHYLLYCVMFCTAIAHIIAASTCLQRKKYISLLSR